MRQPVTFTPWRSIRDGAVGVPARDVSFEAALDSPCSTCRSAPCCTHLPVHTFRVANAADLSQAAYLLNFDRLRLGVKRNGEWSAYYVQPCRFLDRERFACTVHGQPQQPQICVQYNPYTCWYKPSLTGMVSDDFLLVDRARLALLTSRTRFDDLRNIVAMPSWEELADAFRGVSDGPVDTPEPPIADLAFEAWRDEVLGALDGDGDAQGTADLGNGNGNGNRGGNGHGGGNEACATSAALPAPNHEFTYEQLRDPCNGCDAPCCETLTFHQGIPATLSTLDFFRFALGFPGVELFVTDDSWWLVLKTHCRHLQDGRCAVYGKPERPLFCRYYDAWKCTYRSEFGQSRPPGALRIRLEHYAALTETMRFDSRGVIAVLPTVDVMRDHVEAEWRDNAGRSRRTHPVPSPAAHGG